MLPNGVESRKKFSFFQFFFTSYVLSEAAPPACLMVENSAIVKVSANRWKKLKQNLTLKKLKKSLKSRNAIEKYIESDKYKLLKGQAVVYCLFYS